MISVTLFSHCPAGRPSDGIRLKCEHISACYRYYMCSSAATLPKPSDWPWLWPPAEQVSPQGGMLGECVLMQCGMMGMCVCVTNIYVNDIFSFFKPSLSNIVFLKMPMQYFIIYFYFSLIYIIFSCFYLFLFFLPVSGSSFLLHLALEGMQTDVFAADLLILLVSHSLLITSQQHQTPHHHLHLHPHPEPRQRINTTTLLK